MTTETRREEWESKPTAGHETHGQSAVYGPDGKTIALVYDGEANAALIAAAPELLEALKGLMMMVEFEYPAGRAAIAKAEGRL